MLALNEDGICYFMHVVNRFDLAIDIVTPNQNS